MKNNKGFSTLELLISFIIISFVSIAMFRAVLTLNNKLFYYQHTSRLIVFQGSLTNAIQRGLSNEVVNKITPCGTNCYDIRYKNSAIKRLKIDKSVNTIQFGNIIERLPTNTRFIGDLVFDISGIQSNENVKYNTVITFNVAVISDIVDEVFNINITHQYNSKATPIDIVHPGLTLWLDSGNPNSFPGTGNTWFDLSGNNNHGTLTNFAGHGPGTESGFNTSTKFMMFNRHLGSGDTIVNNVVTIPNSSSLNNCLPQNGITISFWLKQTTYTCTAMTKWTDSWEIYYCPSLVWRTQGTGGSDGGSGLNHTTNLDKFHLITATHDGTTRKFYINGEEIYTNNNPVSGQNMTNPISIGAYPNGHYATIGAIPVYMLYNRALTPTEVKQIFNAQRGRFGI
jgi:hypothetical protein